MEKQLLIKMIRETGFSLKKYNTFGVDVKTDVFIEFTSLAELKDIFENELLNKNQNFLVLGEGSNILFTKNFNGYVLKNSIKGVKIISEDKDSVEIKAGAGEHWDDLVNYCVEQNYWGIENLSLIPGTVGAAPIQNIGAYGAELKDVLVAVEGLSVAELKEMRISREEAKLAYRNSIFKNELKNKFIITHVILQLNKKGKPNLSYSGLSNYFKNTPVDKIDIGQIRKAVIEIRRSKLPDPAQLGNAGSFFKNPVVSDSIYNKLKSKYSNIVAFPVGDNRWKIPAGWLIENAGLKGIKIGDAGTYEKQALVIVNYGKSTGKEILELAKLIQKTVKEKFNIELEPEVNII